MLSKHTTIDYAYDFRILRFGIVGIKDFLQLFNFIPYFSFGLSYATLFIFLFVLFVSIKLNSTSTMICNIVFILRIHSIVLCT